MVAEERWLWSAVLQSAVLDYLGRRRVLKDQIQHREIDERAQIESAREWLWDDESRDVGSLRWIGDVLGFDPDHLRQALIRWEKSGAKGKIPWNRIRR